MPCRDYYDDHPDLYFKEVTEPALKARVSFAESALCQTLEAFDKLLEWVGEKDGFKPDVMDQIDFDAAGITRAQLVSWWIEHKRRDELARKEQERLAAKRLAELSKSVGVLSDKDLAAMGLKRVKE